MTEAVPDSKANLEYDSADEIRYCVCNMSRKELDSLHFGTLDMFQCSSLYVCQDFDVGLQGK